MSNIKKGNVITLAITEKCDIKSYFIIVSLTIQLIASLINDI